MTRPQMEYDLVQALVADGRNDCEVLARLDQFVGPKT
jgi:hypothetical protein